jgi:ribonuclease E
VRHRIEDHLAQIYSPVVPLKSGGYLVINQTEALVAVDVNSGRATKERNIEATALKTNMEAAEEACRQLRLRDLAGLIVIDFIDMEEAKNNRAVEKKLKDCLKDDRARIQIGRISSFGLMELSRQRRRTGILEGTTHVCPHCQGAGRVRSVESSALSALRAVELEGLRGGGEIVLRTPRDVGLYLLNAKRDYLMRLRQTHGLWVNVALDDALAAAEHGIERISSEAPPTTARTWEAPAAEPYEPDDADDDLVDEVDEEEEDEAIEPDSDDADEDDDEGAPQASSQHDDDTRPRRGRRRRRGRRGDEPRPAQAQAQAPQPARIAPAEQADGEEGDRGRRRRRGRRGGRRMREEPRAGDVYAWSWPSRPVGDDAYQWRGPVPAQLAPASAPSPVPALPEPVAALETAPQPPIGDDVVGVDVWVELPATEEAPRKGRARRGRGRAAAAEPVAAEAPVIEPVAAAPAEAETVTMAAPPVADPVVEETVVAAVEAAPPTPVLASVSESPSPAPVDVAEIVAPPATPKRGWWRRGA